MSEDLRRDLAKARERARVSEESVDRKIETIEEENFKRSRAQVSFFLSEREAARNDSGPRISQAERVMLT